MEIPLPTSSTDIPIQTKRDVFLLNALENNQYRKALQEILEA